VAPFFGQRARGPRAAEGFYQYDGETQYRYYDLYEQTEIYGQVFQEQERATAINEANRSLVQEVQERLPPEEDRPTVAVGGLWSGTYWASVIYFDVTTPEVVHNGKIRTYSKKQYRETGVVNAFPDENFGEDGPFFLQTDTEGLLKANPDVMFVDNAVNDQEFFEEQVRTLQDDPVASEVAAVQNDRIYPGGTPTQGPIVNMFQTEMVAKQLYPEEFGEWHGLGDVPDGEQLFDRQRVADIVNGNT
jgi:ABC-type Fe3+-hydroxamate transport system substrate-binding protein